MIYDPMRDELFSARRGGGRAAQRRGDPRRRRRPRSPTPPSRSAGTCAPGARNISICCAAWRSGARRRSAPARARSASPMSRPDGATAMSSTTSTPGTASPASCWSARRAATSAIFSRGDGLTKGNPLIACAPGRQGRAHLGRRHRRDCAVTRSSSPQGRARATIALAGAEARTWRVGGRDLLWPGDPAIWADISPILYPVVGWTRDGASGSAAAICARPARLRPVRDLHGRGPGPGLRPPALGDNERTRAVYPFAFALAVEYRLSDDALGMALEIANPGERARALRLRRCIRASAGRSARKGATGAFVRFEKPERGEVPGHRAGRPGQPNATKPVPLNGRDLPLSDALFANDARLLPRLHEPLARLPRRLGRLDRDGVPGLSACRAVDAARRAVHLSRSLDRLQRPRTASPATCSTSRRCACSRPARAPATRRASSTGRAERSRNLAGRSE